jgi:SAM-dependent methyltransferase
MIPAGIYPKGFEIGCSNGILTQLIAPKCGSLCAVDASTIAVENAKKRLKNYAHVKIEKMEIPKDFPDEKFDLVLLSEVGYFLIKEDLIVTRERITNSLLPGGYLLLVHWTPVVDEFPLTGDQVHELFISVSGEEAEQPLLHLKQRIEAQYRMDLFSKK